MWKRRDILRTGTAIIVTLVAWTILRLVFPSLDYFPPEDLVRKLERGWFVTTGLRKATMAAYATVALVLLALFFSAVQERWPGRGSLKGLAFGTSLGVVWTCGFLSGWLFLGTTLKAELLNSINDLFGLMLGGWLIGLALGTDTPGSRKAIRKPWLAVLLIATGFTTVHALGARLLAGLVGPAADLLLVPTTLPQFALLLALGVWAGLMFVVLRAGVPFRGTLASAAFFAFGVFGHSWTWFHVFFVIEFAGVLSTVLVAGLTGAAGVFVGALVYEGLAGRNREAD